LATLESVAAKCVLVGLTHAQTFDAIKTFAAEGRLGPRLYDRLIGEAAVINGFDCIVTWNRSHLSSLFPDIRVLDPIEFNQSEAAPDRRRPRTNMR
jgi:hypothetical protein